MKARVRVISNNGRRSPVSRPVSPRDRFADIPQTSVPPLPSYKPPKSPVLRPTTPRKNDEVALASVPPVPLLGLPRRRQSLSRLASPRIPDVNPPPVPTIFHQHTSPYPKRGDLTRSGHLAFPSTPRDAQYQPRDLTARITREDKDYSACGGYGVVSKGSLENGAEKCMVAIKVLRAHTENKKERQKLDKRLRREIEVWKRLDHQNVVPLLGTVTNPECGPYLSTGMVSPWMVNRDLTRYLPSMKTSLTLLDRLQLLCDVADGLGYLHSMDVIHGDLTGSNILIDHDRKARLVDFGLSTIKMEFEGTSYYSSTVGGALRWRALELVSTSEDNEDLILTTACDIYSYGSVALQVLSGQIPYHGLSESRVLGALCKGIRPRRPSEPGLTDTHWNFIQDCWTFTPGARPSIKQVFQSVLGFRQACVEVESTVQQSFISSHLRSISRNRRPAVPTDGYETDSEAIHGSKHNSTAFGWESEHEDGKRRKISAKKSGGKQLQTITLLNTRRMQKEKAIPAIRTFDLQVPLFQSWRKSIYREISALKAGTHSNIRNIIDVEGVGIVRLTLEPIIGMSLRDILQKGTLTNNQISHVCSKILDGLQHLHNLDIVHGNLNSRNVLLDSEGCLKLTEFGLSARLMNLESNSLDTDNNPYWTAPEVITHRHCSPAMDIWSLGIISIELVEKDPPYFDKDPLTAKELIVTRGTPTLKDPNAFTWELIDFLSSCLVRNVIERATATELHKHKFLSTACSLLGLIPLLDVDAQHAY